MSAGAVKVFQHTNFGQLRVLTRDGEPWFIAKDISDILGYSDAAKMTTRLDDDEKITAKMAVISKTNPMIILINESGFYNAVLANPKQRSLKSG